MKRKTAMERLKELRKEKSKVLTKKKVHISELVPKKVSDKKKIKKFFKNLKSSCAEKLSMFNEQQLLDIIRHKERVDQRFRMTEDDIIEEKRREKIEKKEEKERKAILKEKLSEIDAEPENLDEINKLVKKYSDGSYKYKKYKKYDYDVVNGEFVVNEKQLLKNVKKRRKEMKEGVKMFTKFIENSMQFDQSYLDKIESFSNEALNDHEKKTMKFLKEFKKMSDRSGIYRFK